jgi:NitT/TauT family transport system substrate-binding protein
MAAGNPSESEDPAFAAALFDAVRSKTIPLDDSNGLGHLPAEVWEEWQESLIAGGDLPGPLDDLSAAFTNQFVEAANASMN